MYVQSSFHKTALRLIHFKECNAHTTPSVSNKTWSKFLIKLKIKIIFSSADISATNYFPSITV